MSGTKPMRVEGAPSLYFEDLVLDQPVESSERTVSRDAIVAFAAEYDPQYFHTDPDAAAEHHRVFDDVVASGIHTMAIWRQLDHEIARDIRWICGIAWEDVRWHEPLRPGDRVRARSTILAKRPSSRHPDRGVVTCRYELLRSDGKLVWSCRSISLVDRRGQPDPSADRTA